MSCEHPRADLGVDLPCPWPDCPEGTPNTSVAIVSGQEGVLRTKGGMVRQVEGEEGVTLYQRRGAGERWTWEKLEA